MTSSLVATKLYIPQLRRGLVARARLSERLSHGAQSRLTLVSEALTRDFRGWPGQLTAIVKAVQAVQYMIRDPFGAASIDTAS
ncbi:hypothetical protein ACWKSP_37140 [Micromonosporaceae bacterium Da 78-11]